MDINDVYKIEINSLDHQGRGIGRINNIVVFVPNTLPGEVVEVKLTNIKKKYLEGEVVNYISTSTNRVKPLCSYYDVCGGCDLMHMSYENQVEYKENKIKNIMLRYANIDCVNNIVKCENPLNYRNKVTFQVKNVIGLYKKKSYEIIPVDKCLLADERINNCLKILKQINLDGINNIVVRTSYNDMMIIFMCDKDINIDINLFDCNVIKCLNNKYMVLKGNNYIIDKIGDKKYKISPTAFFQVNSKQTKKLYDLVLDYLELDGTENVLDLYCGTGTIGIYIASNAKEVLGVEINKNAIMDAEFNKNLNNVSNIKFIAGDSSKVIHDINFKPDKVIVDPPRAGLDHKLINEIIKMNPSRIVYVSCDPITLVRDLNLFKEKYDIKYITPVDMFCHTEHVETVSVLKRK